MTSPTWQNWARNQKVYAEALVRPSTVAELREIVRRATRERKRLKPVARGHSFSDILQTDGVVLDVTGIDGDETTGLLPLEDELFTDSVAETLVRVACGARIMTLSQSLRTAGLCFENLGGFAGQTLIGAISTSTHGSGLRLGPLPDAVRSLDLVTTGGRMLRIEPSRGITDRRAFARAYRPTELELVQDDDLFHSVVVSLGTMGVVRSAVVRVAPSYLLRQRRIETTWSRMRGELTAERLLGNHRHVELLLHPHANRAGEHRAVLTLRDIPPPDLGWDGDIRRARDRRGKNPPLRDFNEWLVSLDPVQGAVGALVNADPSVVVGLIDASLDTLLDPPLTVQDCTSLFDIGRPNHVRALSAEYGFPLSTAARAVDRLLAQVAENRSRGLWHTCPISLRFVKASTAHLSMMYGRDTCMVETPLLASTRGAAHMLYSYERAFSAGGYGCRPHWGQLNALTGGDFLHRAYPEAERWVRAVRALNDRGIFDNHFTDRLGVSVSAKDPLAFAGDAPHREAIR